MSQNKKAAIPLWDRPYPMLIATAAMWGANTIFSRLAVNEISPMLLTFCRWIAVCAISWLIAGKHLKAYWPILKPKLPLVGLMGTIGFTTFNAFMYAAAYHTTAVNISIIQGSQPIMVLIGAALLFHTPINWQQIVGITLTLIGIAAIALRGQLETLLNLSFNIGDLFMLAASFCYGIYTLCLRNKPIMPPLLFFAIMTTAATLSSIPLVAYEFTTGTIIWPTQLGWLITGAIVIFPSCLAQLFFIRGVEIIGPARAAVFINLIPAFGTTFAIIFLHEPFTLVQAIGLTLVLFGIWLAERR